jgi:hypothetical protein
MFKRNNKNLIFFRIISLFAFTLILLPTGTAKAYYFVGWQGDTYVGYPINIQSSNNQSNNNYNNTTSSTSNNTSRTDNTNSSVNNTTTETKNQTTNEKSVSDLAAGAIFGTNAFLPSSLLQWFFFAILVLLGVILWRKLYVSDEDKKTPLKHA